MHPDGVGPESLTPLRVERQLAPLTLRCGADETAWGRVRGGVCRVNHPHPSTAPPSRDHDLQPDELLRPRAAVSLRASTTPSVSEY